MQTEHKRIKHHQMPGDLSKGTIIRLRERRGLPLWPFLWQGLDIRQAQAIRRFLKERSKSRQRQRDREVIQASIAQR
jgi:hypothetical protein